ncbi:MAG TPA: substrate-binding domain-containing protein [Streptosporangiaceae bacterium]
MTRKPSTIRTLAVVVATAGLTVAGAVTGTVISTVISAGPALADPPGGTVPAASAAVGVGAQTDQYLLDQLSYDYYQAHSGAPTQLYSWDGVNPDTQQAGDEIQAKAGCSQISRPGGSSAGLAALEASTVDPAAPNHYCIDFARYSLSPASAGPQCTTGGICFVSLAGDAVSWAVRNAASGGTDAPASLTAAQLVKIFECQVTNWAQVGGQNAPIEAFLPQTSSDTRTAWLTALGGGSTPITPGLCVSDLNNTLQENEGINPVLDSPEAIFIYSVGDYIAQAYHSPQCINAGCTPVDSTTACGNTGSTACAPAATKPPCNPDPAQNKFGCNKIGALALAAIGGRYPIGTPRCAECQNGNFAAAFQIILSIAVRFDSHTADHIPGPEAGSPGGVNLEQFIGGPSGWLCSSPAAQADVQNYGFLSTGPQFSCGAVTGP